LVSVVIPTYRHERTIEETLASVFAQTFTDFEVIVINDGSPDRTVDRLRPWIDAGRIRYHEQPNAGQSAARNIGIGLARGEFLALLDDDDLWPADKLAWQSAALRQNPRAVVSYGYAESFGLERNYRLPASVGPQGAVYREILAGNFLVSPGQAMIRTSAIRELGGLDRSISGAEDWDLWIRLSQLGDFVYEDRCSLRYRLHANNASGNTRKMFNAGMQVVHKHLGRTPFSHRWAEWLRARQFVGRFTATLCIGKAIDEGPISRTFVKVGHLATATRFYPPVVLHRLYWSALLPRPAKPYRDNAP
jgi:glycosyltransferase involved in cell wall biosynthesis